MAIERDKEVLIWTFDEDHARHFFGFPADRPVRTVKEEPETAAEIEQYAPNAKLFAVLAHEPPADYQPGDAVLSEEELQSLLDTAPMTEPEIEQMRRLNGTVPPDEWEL